MAAPVIEQPRFACGHVNGFAAAVKPHRRRGHHRDVQPHARMPVQVDIGMVGDAVAGRQAHEP